MKTIDVKLNLWNGRWSCERVTVGPHAIINSLPSDWLNNNPIPLSIMSVHLPQFAYLKNAL